MGQECEDDYFATLQPLHGMPMFYFQFLYNVLHSRAQHRIIPLPMPANEGARVLIFHGLRPDLIYIDASHHALDVTQDLEHFWFLLACGGTMFGDDWHWAGVQEAVKAFACRHNLTLELVRLGPHNTKWIFWRKNCDSGFQTGPRE